jgi:hypothetical protein
VRLSRVEFLRSHRGVFLFSEGWQRPQLLPL